MVVGVVGSSLRFTVVSTYCVTLDRIKSNQLSLEILCIPMYTGSLSCSLRIQLAGLTRSSGTLDDLEVVHFRIQSTPETTGIVFVD